MTERKAARQSQVDRPSTGRAKAGKRAMPGSTAAGLRRPAVEAPPQRRSQVERSARTRERLIAAAFEILHRQGYSGASTVAIAKAAGVSLGALQHQFPTKALLMTAVLRRIAALRIAAYRAALKSVGPGPERFAALSQASWAQIGTKELAASMEIELAMRNDPDLAATAAPTFARHGAFMSQLVGAALKDRGGVDQKRAEAIRLLNNAVMVGLTMEVIRGTDAKAVKDALASWRDVLINDLAAPAPKKASPGRSRRRAG